MTLAAAQVIDAVAARLVPLVATGGRVYTSRAWPLDTLPAWRVTAGDEAIRPATMEPLNEHSLPIEARGFVRATGDLDDALHALAASGLTLLFAPAVPYGLTLEGINRQLSTDGEASVGVITLRLRATFWVDPAQPETIFS